MTITLHHLENSRSQRVLWLLEELGLPYELKLYKRDRKTSLAPPELTQVHPLGKSPVITENGNTVAESGAIIEYLLDAHAVRHGKSYLRPAPSTPERLRFTYWLHFAEGSAMPYLLMKLVFDKVQQAPAPFFVKPVVKNLVGRVNAAFLMPNIKRQMAFIESELAQRTWFAGDEFTAADIQMSYPVEAAAARIGLASSHPNIKAWLAGIHARPAYIKALEVGGPYAVVP
jgi:glutathione S-transferase